MLREQLSPWTGSTGLDTLVNVPKVFWLEIQTGRPAKLQIIFTHIETICPNHKFNESLAVMPLF